MPSFHNFLCLDIERILPFSICFFLLLLKLFICKMLHKYLYNPHYLAGYDHKKRENPWYL